ncbi:MAG TPA: hypothetical protein VGE06_06435, partial [Flavisolibacter sp.]
MRNGSRHISAGIFSTMLLLPVLAMLLLQLGRAYIQSTREERLHTESLVTVVLPAGQVVWEEDEKELWVGNRMFDVASYTILDGHYHLTGVYDDDETEVAGSLLHFFLSQDDAAFLQFLLLLQAFAGSLLLIQDRSTFFIKKKRTVFHLN